MLLLGSEGGLSVQSGSRERRGVIASIKITPTELSISSGGRTERVQFVIIEI